MELEDYLSHYEELLALANAIRFSEGFKLFFAIVDLPTQREELQDQLALNLGPIRLRNLSFTAPVRHLIDEIRVYFGEDTMHTLTVSSLASPLAISGLELTACSSLTALSDLTANLNASRDIFPKVFKYPIIIWCSRDVLGQIATGAPDFFSIRSGTFHFNFGVTEILHFIEDTLDRLQEAPHSLSLLQASYLLQISELLFSNLRITSDVNIANLVRTPIIEMMARLELRLGKQESAQDSLKLLYDLCVDSQEVSRLEFALSELGRAEKDLGNNIEARRWFELLLRHGTASKDLSVQLLALRNLGELAEELEEWDFVEDDYKQLWAVSILLADVETETFALHRLFTLYTEQRRLLEAAQVSQLLLDLPTDPRSPSRNSQIPDYLKKLPDRTGPRAHSIYASQGDEALIERWYETSDEPRIETFSELGIDIENEMFEGDDDGYEEYDYEPVNFEEIEGFEEHSDSISLITATISTSLRRLSPIERAIILVGLGGDEIVAAAGSIRSARRMLKAIPSTKTIPLHFPMSDSDAAPLFGMDTYLFRLTRSNLLVKLRQEVSQHLPFGSA